VVMANGRPGRRVAVTILMEVNTEGVDPVAAARAALFDALSLGRRQARTAAWRGENGPVWAPAPWSGVLRATVRGASTIPVFYGPVTAAEVLEMAQERTEST